MSYHHRGRGYQNTGSQRHKRHDEHKLEGSLTKFVESSRRSDRGRPLGLRGKSIGMYYKEKRKLALKSKLSIKISDSSIASIQRMIKHSNSSDDTFQNAELQNDNIDFMSKYSHITDSQFKTKFLKLISGNLQEKLEQALDTAPLLKRSESIDIKLSDELNDQRSSSQYKNSLNFRKKLPVYENKKKILDFINANQVVLISGETGCGKTTQIAQFILDYEIEFGRGSTTCIACTQPRRISAISIAERVAAERGDKLGNSVGYHIRLEKLLPRSQGSIVFCTIGMLLQFIQTDAALRNYSHIILDEIHERSTQSDFIITLLKLIVPKRPDLKLVLMSATLNAEQFSKYYNDCPLIHIPGLTYPVEELYLEDVLYETGFKFFTDTTVQPVWKKYLKKHKEEQEKLNDHKNFISSCIQNDETLQKYPSYVLEQLYNPKSEDISYDLIFQLTLHICCTKESGAILIFLPGLANITTMYRMFLDSTHFSKDQFILYALHSKMPSVEQKKIFDVPPPGVRKIIIATIIAETSITIEDVVYVIDCGKTKLSKFDTKNNLQTLETEWVSESNALQRKGRAGRVRPGICYHLYTRARAKTFAKYPLPEMLITRLEEVILQIKILQIGKSDTFLSTVMDPPDPKTISLSLELLRQLKALDERENLTPLGYHLAKLPLDPRTGKMILWAAMFSCIDPIFAIAASLSFKDPFYCPLGKEQEAEKKKIELGLNEYSDHIALYEALKRFEDNNYRGRNRFFCQEFFLSWNTLKLLSDMKKQFARNLCEMKFLNNDNPKDRMANINSHNKSLIKAIVCAGFYPNIAIIDKVNKGGVQALTIEKEMVQLHPSSINSKAHNFPFPYLTYFLKRKSSQIYLFDTTCVSPIALVFAAPNLSVERLNYQNCIRLPNNEVFECNAAFSVKKLHEKLDDILEYKINHPGVTDWDAFEGQILKAT